MHSLPGILILAASALAAPTAKPVLEPRANDNTCVELSQAMKTWTVEQFDFHSSYIFTTPSHQNSNGFVNFTLNNPAVDYKPICSARSSQLQDFFYGTVIYDCQMPEGAPEGAAATFDYSRPSGQLRINQTWPCVEEGARFEARGGVKLDLNCRDKKWKNPNWEMGQIYSSRTVTCNFVDAQAPVEQITGVA
jgi:hypothetical protein